MRKALLRITVICAACTMLSAYSHAQSDQQMDADGDQTRHIRWRAEAGANCPLGHNAPTLTLVSQLGRTA